jgi:hypothetical protein
VYSALIARAAEKLGVFAAIVAIAFCKANAVYGIARCE